jgi:excisionase family DNA binding protein
MTSPKLSERELARRVGQRALSIAEFSDRYGVGRTTTYEEIKSGRLRARKIGKRTLIGVDDAEEWLRHLPLVGAASRTSMHAR